MSENPTLVLNAQACVVRSADGGSVQGAVIVRNNNSVLSTTAAAKVSLYSASNQGVWGCDSTTHAKSSWSVCFGRTLTLRAAAHVDGKVNGQYLRSSPTL